MISHQLNPEFNSRLDWLLSLLAVREDDLIELALSALSPYQPGSLRQKLERRQHELGRDVKEVPTTSELWKLFEYADFRCSKPGCKSQISLTIDRINPSFGYEKTNVRILCRDCNREASRPNTAHQKLRLKIFQAIYKSLQANPDDFPSNFEIQQTSGVRSLSGSLYLVRFLRRRWEQSRTMG